jgi:hypothetical protein
MYRPDRLVARRVLILHLTRPVQSHSLVDLRASFATSRSLQAGAQRRQ